VTLNHVSWSDTQIVFSGFGGEYGRNGFILSSGGKAEVGFHLFGPQADDAGAGLLILRPQPADLTAPLLGRAFGVERDQPFEDGFVGQVPGLAVGLEGRAVAALCA
jgi:hypothetical protein